MLFAARSGETETCHAGVSLLVSVFVGCVVFGSVFCSLSSGSRLLVRKNLVRTQACLTKTSWPVEVLGYLMSLH